MCALPTECLFLEFYDTQNQRLVAAMMDSIQHGGSGDTSGWLDPPLPDDFDLW